METIGKKTLVCEPLKDGVMLTQRIKDSGAKSVLIIFWHGIGDLVMFVNPFRMLCLKYPDIHFELGLPKGLTHEEILPPWIPVRLVTGEEVNDTPEQLPYDIVAKVTFPMSEGQTEFTKGEYCCIHELGIDPVAGHGHLGVGVNRLVGVHFCITCLPDSCNPDRETAEKIWNDILDAGFIPIETHFQHIFHNPVNTKFDFVDCTVRRARAQSSSLVGLLRQCGAFVGVVSGNFHVAMSVLPTTRVLLLEKDFKREMFTKENIAHADLRNYQGEVKTFLEGLDK